MTTATIPPTDNLPTCREPTDLYRFDHETQVALLTRVAAVHDNCEDDTEIEAVCHDHGIDLATYSCLAERSEDDALAPERASDWDLANAPSVVTEIAGFVREADRPDEGRPDEGSPTTDDVDFIEIDLDIDEMRHSLWVAYQRQTLTEELHFDPNELEGPAGAAETFLSELLAIAEHINMSVECRPPDALDDDVAGCVHFKEMTISLDETLSTIGRATVLAHELGHVYDALTRSNELKDRQKRGLVDQDATIDDTDDEAKRETEFVAETVAHVICAYYGFDTTNRYVFAANLNRPRSTGSDDGMAADGTAGVEVRAALALCWFFDHLTETRQADAASQQGSGR